MQHYHYSDGLLPKTATARRPLATDVLVQGFRVHDFCPQILGQVFGLVYTLTFSIPFLFYFNGFTLTQQPPEKQICTKSRIDFGDRCPIRIAVSTPEGNVSFHELFSNGSYWTYAVRVNVNQDHHRPRITEGGHRIHLGIPTMMIGEKNIWTELPMTGIAVKPTLRLRSCKYQRHILHCESGDDSRTCGRLQRWGLTSGNGIIPSIKPV